MKGEALKTEKAMHNEDNVRKEKKEKKQQRYGHRSLGIVVIILNFFSEI